MPIVAIFKCLEHCGRVTLSYCCYTDKVLKTSICDRVICSHAAKKNTFNDNELAFSAYLEEFK